MTAELFEAALEPDEIPSMIVVGKMIPRVT
jgi:hypothetical protein